MTRQRRITYLLIGMMLVVALTHISIAAQNDRQAEALLQRALSKEFIDGDIEGAIKQYKEVVSTYGNNHAAAAKALIRLGTAYERTANNAEAQKAFDQVIQKYGDQKDAVVEAQSHLKGTTRGSSVYAPKTLTRACVGCSYDSVSPDGRYLLGDGLKDLVTGEERDFENYREGIIIAPDGRMAYAALGSGGSYEIRTSVFNPQTDGPEKTIFHSDEYDYLELIGWSRDAKDVYAVFARNDDTWLIGAVSINNGTLRPIKSLDWREPDKASLSPNGQYIVYDLPINKQNQINHDIFLLAVDGGLEIPLVQDSSRDVTPVWTPDGKAIIFESDRSAKLGLWKLEIADGKPKGEPTLIRTVDEEIYPLGFASNGAFYYRVQHALATDIFTADIALNSGTVTRAASRAIDRFPGRNSSPSYSPDGRSLAYISQRNPSGGSVSIVIHSIESNEERETPVPFSNVNKGPVWSPDGKSLLYGLGDNLHLIDLSSHEDHQVGDSIRSTPPIFSPDGKRVYFARIGQSRREQRDRTLVEYDLKTNMERVLFEGQLPSRATAHIAISPDGTQIATLLAEKSPPTLTDPEGTATGKPVLRIVPVSGGPSKTLQSPDTQALTVIRWSENGKDVLVQRGNGQLWWVPTDGGDARRIGNINFPTIESLSPDGKHIANTQNGTRQPTEVWVDPELFRIDSPRPSGGLYVVRVDPATGKVRGTAATVNGKPADGSCAPAFSPDGKSIGFKRAMPNNNGSNVWEWVVRSLTTGDEKTFSLVGRTQQAACWIAPLWSHDGKTLLNGSFLEANGKVFQVDLENAKFKDLDIPNYKPAMSFSLDNKTLFMTSHDQKNKITSIVAVDLATGKQSGVWVSPAPSDPNILVPLRLALSPDGRSLALVLSEGAKSQLIRVGTDGQNYKILYSSSSESSGGAWLSRSGLAWSKDGRSIYFMQADKNFLRMMRMSADGGKPEFTGLEIPSTDAVFDISADGTQIAIASPGPPRITLQTVSK